MGFADMASSAGKSIGKGAVSAAKSVGKAAPTIKGGIGTGAKYLGAGALAGLAAGKAVATYPTRVAEGQGGGIVPNVSRVIPEFLRNWLRFLVKFVFGSAIILLIVLGLIAGYNYYQTGYGSSAITHGTTAVKNTPIPVLSQLGLENVYYAIFDPAKITTTYGFESDIQQSQTTPFTVQITKLEQVGIPPDYGQPIEIMGAIEATSPKDDLKLIVFCKLGDNEIIPAEVSSSHSSGNEATLFKEIPESIQATCIFENGINPEKANVIKGLAVNPLSKIQKEVPLKSTESATMYVRYEFKAEASHRTYFMDSDQLAQILRLPSHPDPFTYYKVNDPQLTSDRRIRSIATSGPVNLGITTLTSQPFVQNTKYALVTTLSNNRDWGGNLRTIQSLNLHIPEYLYLEGDSEFGQAQMGSVCDFQPTNQKDEDRYKIYTAKESALAKINMQCDKETLDSKKISLEQCIDLYGKNREIMFRCNFKAPTLPVEAGPPKWDLVRADVDYIYQTEKSVAVDAKKGLSNIA